MHARSPKSLFLADEMAVAWTLFSGLFWRKRPLCQQLVMLMGLMGVEKRPLLVPSKPVDNLLTLLWHTHDNLTNKQIERRLS